MTPDAKANPNGGATEPSAAVEGPATPDSRLAALGAHLSARGYEVNFAGSALSVVNPRERQLCDSITCRSRQEDGGRLWFFTSWNDPIAPANHVVDTALRVQGYLRPAKR